MITRPFRLLLAVAFALLCAGAWAAPQVSLRLAAQGFSLPVELVNARDGSGRLFVVEQGGRIRILLNGSVLATPFLDLSASGLMSTGGERGLLGLAFHPQYGTNGAFYIFYTHSGDGALTVARYLRKAASANEADPASAAVLLTVPHADFPNHNGGHLAFGPDGYLYIGTGDGGNGGDPPNNAQNRGRLLGKLLRIDVDGGTTYAIPPGNPFAGASSCNNGAAPDASGTCPEIWAYGLRNPWKFSFDRTTGDLLIGDVGQSAREEVDFQPDGAAGGRNYGWRVFEGNNCFSDSPTPCASLAEHVPPVISYGHEAEGGVSITGGYRYRGSRSLALRGYYVYGDFGSTRIWAARPDGNGVWQPEVLFEPPVSGIDSISSFGEDEAGELYVVSYGNGKIWALDGAPPGVARNDFDGDGRSDIFWLHTVLNQTFEWQMNGSVIGAGSGPVQVTGDNNWQVKGIGDFDGDGKADVLWRHTDGTVYQWKMNGTIVTGSLLGTVDPAWTVQGVGDFNGDGKADVLWLHTDGTAYVWTMNGTSYTGSVLATVAPGWAVQGIGDFNGDGKADVLWRHGDGTVYLWKMNGAAFTGAALPQVTSNWAIQGVGDLNGDGKADILWLNTSDSMVYVWMMNDTTFVGSVLATLGQPGWQVKGIGDYNGDGKADVLWRNGQATYAWLMTGSGTTFSGQNIADVDPLWQIQNPK